MSRQKMYPKSLTVQMPAWLAQVVATAAAERCTTPVEWCRQAILDAALKSGFRSPEARLPADEVA